MRTPMVGGWSLFAFSKYELYEVFFFFIKDKNKTGGSIIFALRSGWRENAKCSMCPPHFLSVLDSK